MLTNQRNTWVEFKDVCYKTINFEILKNISFKLNEGDFLAIIGPNGGGKTTLLRLMLGTLSVTSGAIIRSQLISKFDYGYLPQGTDLPLKFPADVLSIVLMGKNLKISSNKSDLKLMALDLLRKVGIYEHRYKRFDELSGGQKQRALLARALMHDPKILLLDEPLSNVDPNGRQCIVEILLEIVPTISIVMVSHDLGLTAHAVSRLAAVNKYLEITDGSNPTSSMLRLMYGIHEEGCLHWPNVG